MEGFSSGFQSRANEVALFLRRHDTAFVLVTTPEAARVGETLAFHRELMRAGLPFGGFIVNRVLPAHVVSDSAPDPSRETGADAALARKLALLRARFHALATAERAEIAQLERAAPDAPIVEIPLQADEPTSLRTLALIADALDG